MEDGHFLSFATISLGLTLLFVLSLGGVFIYLFLKASNEENPVAVKDPNKLDQ